MVAARQELSPNSKLVKIEAGWGKVMGDPPG